MPTRILIIDDDSQIRDSVSRVLAGHGYEVHTAAEGEEGLRLFAEQNPDVVILDITLPAEGHGPTPPPDGIEVLRRIRRESDAYVIMLSATAASAVKVGVLSMGADDYLTKPFHSDELVARVQAMLRRKRGRATEKARIDSGDLAIDADARQVYKRGKLVALTALEFDLLHTLASHPGRVFSRYQLIERAWKFDYAGGDRVVDVHIGNLRKKIEDDPALPTYIVTVRGVGYRFDGPA